VLFVVNDDRLFAPGRHEDLDGRIVIAVGALVERTLNATSVAARARESN
jgi:hypothetical protein